MNEINSEQLSDVYKDLCSLIGLEHTLLIYSNYRGQQISFPVKLISREYIIKQIQSEFNGSNAKDLAVRYDYSERWVREIVKKVATKDNSAL